MPRIPIAIGALAVLAVTIDVVALTLADTAIATSSVFLIAAGLMIISLAGLAGLLLARAPWGRWTMAFAVVTSMGLASVSSSPTTVVGYALGGVALVGLFGPWLRLWIRHHRVVDGPGSVPVFLMSAGVAAPLLMGLATAAHGAGWLPWTTASVALVASTLYGRGARVGLWCYRVAVGPLGAWCALVTGGVGGVVIAAATLSVVVAAWLPAARRTTTVITPILPEPIRRR